jgi:hypothetical protein
MVRSRGGVRVPDARRGRHMHEASLLVGSTRDGEKFARDREQDNCVRIVMSGPRPHVVPFDVAAPHPPVTESVLCSRLILGASYD